MKIKKKLIMLCKFLELPVTDVVHDERDTENEHGTRDDGPAADPLLEAHHRRGEHEERAAEPHRIARELAQLRELVQVGFPLAREEQLRGEAFFAALADL